MITYKLFFHHQFKLLYVTMNHMLVNEARLFDAETIRVLLVGSGCFKRKKDRSIVIFGMYAVTLDSVGPVSRFVDTN